MTRNAIWLAVLVAAPSLAQEWTPPPEPPTPPATQPPEETPGPAPVTVSPPSQPPQPVAPAPATQPPSTPPAFTPAPATTEPAPARRTAPPPAATPAPTEGGAKPTGAAKVTVVPGSEPHSPGTAGFAIDDQRNMRVAASEIGGPGLWHVMSADLGRPGLFHLSVAGEFMSLNNFPVLNASNTWEAGTFALSYVPIEHLAAYLSFQTTANSNTSSSPPLMEAQYINLGVEGAFRPVKGLDLGLDARALFFPGIGSLSVGQYAAGFAPRAVATFDLREYVPQAPVRFHLNLGFIFDGTGRFTAQTLSPAEEFALGINKYNRLALDLGLEVPLPYVTGIVEYGFGYPLWAEPPTTQSGGTLCGNTGTYTGPDGVCVTAGQAMPQYVGIVAKVTAFKDVTPTIGIQFGLSQRVARGIPATQPFNFVLGVSYNLDPLARGESKIIEHAPEKLVQAPPPSTGKITGVVLDSETKKPVGGALITMDSGALPPVASDPSAGKFMSYELPPGKISVSVVKEGYKPVAQDATVEVGKVASLEISLVREVKKAVVTLKASSNKKPVVARFTFEGAATPQAPAPAGLPVVGVTDASGAGTANVPAGHLHVSVNADGYLSKAREIDAVEGGQVVLDMELTPVPKKPLVSIVENKIVIKQQVHFNTNKASILADSYPLLDQVVDAIIKANLKKVRIEGNTDNVGGKKRNMTLSQQRAESVRDYLVKNGIEASRFEAVGNGDTKPIAPNLTARGRELNRRVEFFILER